MDTVREFLAMGGYAAFVWPAFVITIGLMVLLVARSYQAMAMSERTLAALEAGRQNAENADDAPDPEPTS